MRSLMITAFLLLSSVVKAYTVQDVYNELVLNGVQHPEIVIKQCVLETGWLKSRLCTKGNNLFAMSKPKKRKTYAIGYYNKTQYAVYKSWQESVKDYAVWQRMFYRKGNYYKFLANLGYAEASDYIHVLKGIRVRLVKRVPQKTPELIQPRMINKIEQLRIEIEDIKSDIAVLKQRRAKSNNYVEIRAIAESIAVQNRKLLNKKESFTALHRESDDLFKAFLKKQYPEVWRELLAQVEDTLNSKYHA